MQTITETRRDEAGNLQEQVSRLTGYESENLSRAFTSQRKTAESRLASGETEKLTIKETRRIGRNDPCPCGSGVKFKRCCGQRLAANDVRIAD